MKITDPRLSTLSSFKIVLIYAVVSAVYIYASDYFLRLVTSDVEMLTKLQTYKGLGFILITSGLLYVLVKRNMDTTSSHFRQIIESQLELDRQLIRSQEDYTALFDNSPLPMWLFDPGTLRFLLVNEAACRVYQFSREEFLSMTLGDIRPPQDVAEMQNIITTSFHEDRFSIPNVVRHQKKNGEIMQVKLNIALVNFKGKKVRLASVIDTTAEIEIQNKLLDLNSRLQIASEIAGLGYWTNDLEKSEIHWSEEIYKIFELNPETFVLTLDNIIARFHPDERQSFSQEHVAALEHHKIKEAERRIITSGGKVKWVLERQYLTKNSKGAAVRIEGIVLDITKRKLHEQSIKESNERFKMLARATVEAIIDWDIENNEVIWGEGFRTMLGYDLRENNFHLWSKNIHPDDRIQVLYELKKTMLDPTKHHFNAEFRFLKANGETIFVQHRGIFIRDANGKATRALGAMIDLTEALTRIRKIELQDKALKEIAWTQSHVVRAPLANLMGLIGLLKNNVTTGVSDEVLLGYISDSAEKLDTVIRSIVTKTTIAEQESEV